MRFLVGPELFWFILYLLASLLKKINTPPSKAMDGFIENLWFWIPILSLLVFLLWKISMVEKNWLLTRVWIAGIVGGSLVIEKALNAYSEQGPGIGMGYLAGIMLLCLMLIVGSIVVKIYFRNP